MIQGQIWQSQFVQYEVWSNGTYDFKPTSMANKTSSHMMKYTHTRNCNQGKTIVSTNTKTMYR